LLPQNTRKPDAPSDVVEVGEDERHRHETELRLPVAQRAEIRPAHVERAERQRLGGGAEVEELRGRLDVDRDLAARAFGDVLGEILGRAVDERGGRDVVGEDELDGLGLRRSVEHRRGDDAARGGGKRPPEAAARELGHGHFLSGCGLDRCGWECSPDFFILCAACGARTRSKHRGLAPGPDRHGRSIPPLRRPEP
jgi:hypothetical protein